MSFGIKIINAEGSQIIDENHFNFTLKTKDTVSYAAGAAPLVHNVTVEAVNPLIAFYCTSDWRLCLFSSFEEDGVWTFSVRLLTVTVGTTPALSFEYFIFDNPDFAPTSGYGFAVKNALGQTTFDYNQKPMRVGYGTLDSSRKWAFCFTRNSVQFLYAPEDISSTVYMTGVRNIAGSSIFDPASNLMGIDGPPFDYLPPFEILPIDVTGY